MGKTNMALLCCCLYKITPKFGMSHQRVPILSAATSSRDSAASILSTTVGNSSATTSKNGAKLAEPPQVVLGPALVQHLHECPRGREGIHPL